MGVVRDANTIPPLRTSEASASFIRSFFDTPRRPGISGAAGSFYWDSARLGRDVAMSERWTGTGPIYGLSWGGRDWVLDLRSSEPGLSADDGQLGPILAVAGVVARGRPGPVGFGPGSLVSHECRFGRVEARYRLPESETFALRAAWSPGPGGAVDLEVQIQASSVDEWRGVEVIVSGALAGSIGFDGLAVAVVSGEEGRPAAYVEIAHPEDLAPRPEGDDAARLFTDPGRAWARPLFGHDLERGVVLRGRVRGIWLPSRPGQTAVDRLIRSFLAEPPPLGT